MELPFPSLRTVTRSAAGLVGLTGAYGVLALLGAFGPVACISESVGGEGVSSEGASSQGASSAGASSASASTSGEAANGCVSGIDYVLSGGEAAPEFFAWPMVLLAFVVLGGAAAWTGRRRATWLIALVGVVIWVVGFLSIGWYFALPTLFLLVAAVALTVEARRDFDGSRSRST